MQTIKNPDTREFVKKQIIMLKIESRISNITGLATSSALTAVETKIPDLSKLVEKKQIIMQK